MRRLSACGVALLLAAAPAAARDSLGVFGRWGAFREAPASCFAIGEPVRNGRRAAWRPFASVATWPARGVRNQLHIRLSRAAAAGRPILLVVGASRFTLTGGGADAWAADARADAAIVSAIRGAEEMTVSAEAESGRSFTDSYQLAGAATAIDAAALGCPRR